MVNDTISSERHQDAIRTNAIRLLSKGYDVRARLEGWFDAPDDIYGYRPDIIARRGNRCLIVEVKKGPVDFPKLAALTRFAKGQRGCHLVILTR